MKKMTVVYNKKEKQFVYLDWEVGWVENWKNHIFNYADSNYHGILYMFQEN